MKKTLLCLAAMLPLAACIRFGAEPPPSLMTLSAQTAVPVGQEQDSGAAKSITIQVPAVPQALASGRVPVQVSPTSIAYIKDAQWSEPPARLFARLMSDTVAARTGRVVLSTSQSVSDPGARLNGELRAFGVEEATREAVVTFDAALTRVGQSNVEKRRFEARVPVTAIDAQNAGPAINQAANQVAVQVADWIGR
ncbi:ABC-type transport auxiliary lipoprotein family protein [Sphingomonas carotinifaciens]|uniref:ABC transporter n=1 Tax=Sphingomonas carotinifaciens TaxID=1166323 RepID=A0A1G7G0J3_9SPHN|nr:MULTISPECIES: ABC-type transport auxiliary lipoprotein family protein [Sphingomonas]MBB4086324.1 cholesterol transport system auxiliary component [Sphingomonas carotinifaciens]MWC42644.1 ABC transporter [Sphingomonas carotinifaciens]SDE81678.1 cholesterol transport system auxiliary component [Sphingomonas carotinifaciens]